MLFSNWLKVWVTGYFLRGEYLRVLNQGVTIWNTWYSENMGTNPFFCGALFMWKDLSGVNLRRADLRYVKLNGAKLIRARFDGASLTGASLRNAWLWGASLRSADLSFADLRGAQFTNAIGIPGEGNVDLTYADFNCSNLVGADFSSADLRNAKNLSLKQLSKASSLHNTKLDEKLLKEIREGYKHLLEGPKSFKGFDAKAEKAWKKELFQFDITMSIILSLIVVAGYILWTLGYHSFLRRYLLAAFTVCLAITLISGFSKRMKERISKVMGIKKRQK